MNTVTIIHTQLSQLDGLLWSTYSHLGAAWLKTIGYYLPIFALRSNGRIKERTKCVRPFNASFEAYGLNILPFGNLTVYYVLCTVKSQFLIGKSSINWSFSMANC